MRKSNRAKSYMFIHPRRGEKTLPTDSLFWAVFLVIAFIIGLEVYCA